ncbi:MAG TPA: hypothetical protein VF157_01655 [Chloroflexota bacterium]
MARLVKTLVCAYTRGELPAPWLVAFHRFEAAMERAGFDVRVKLAPLEELPEDGFEVLVVPPELAARAEASGAYILATTAADAPAAIDRLLKALAAGQDLRAEQADPTAPRVERFRGFLPL